LTGVGLFAWQGAKESRTSQQRSLDLAFNRAVALAEHRGRWVMLSLHGGKVAAGRIVDIDKELLIIYVDIRRPQQHGNASYLEYPTSTPQLQDLVDVDLTEVDHVNVHT
jgi:hypothetical protein